LSKANIAPVECHILLALRASHDHQRHGAYARSSLLQLAKKLPGAVQIAIDDERIDFAVGELLQGALRFAFDGDIHVQTSENAFQNADFLPIARNHHR
jgi:hypothetical protein